LSVNWYKSW